MINTMLTYLNQRFKGIMYFPLALYLLLYANGTIDFQAFSKVQLLILFICMTCILLIFRVFDDLQSRQEDQGKANRIYTIEKHVPSIRILLFLSLLVCGILSLIFIPDAVVHFTILIVIGMSAYIFQPRLGAFAFIAPLTKYALIILSFSVFFHNDLLYTDILASLSILAAFIAYELIEDPSIRVDRKWEAWSIIIMLILCLAMASSMTSFIIMAIISVAFYGIYKYKLLAHMHYIVLIILLILRLTSYAF